MASAKKIIAICQSGGGFATNEEDGSLYYTGGEAHALDLDQDTQLKDFKQELSETFDCSVNGMAIKYFLPKNKKTLITVSKDKDLKRMFNFFKDYDQVEVFVIAEEQPVAARHVLNTPANRSGRAASEAIVRGLVDDLFGPRDLMEMDEPLNQWPHDIYPSGSEEQHRRAAIQWENLITGVDQRFNSLAEFRDALHKYSIAHGFNYKYKKSESHRVTVKCKTEGCPWRIHASRLSTTQLICIKKMNPKHTCEGTSVKAGCRARWVANMIKEKLKASPHYKPKDIAVDIKREYGIQLTYAQARRAMEIAREQLQGTHSEAYSLLPFFFEKIMETNPGSIAKFYTKEDSSFQRLFVAFHALISGFRACRPLIFLDSTLIYSKYQGTLLAATAADGNDGAFPVAFAVVDEETDDNWHWFLSELKSAVSTSRQITFVADLEKGISLSLRDIFGDDCYHAYCLRYLAKKLNKDLKGQFSHEARRLMLQDLSSAAFAPKLDVFERCAENIKAISPEAYNWVLHSEPKNWANAFFPGMRYNHMTSNFGQLFHSWVSEAEELPITQMVDVLRGKMMELIYTRRVQSSQWTTRLCPLIEEKFRTESSKARSLQIIHSEGNTYQVRGDSVEIVAIDRWDCSCKGWQLTGLPCCHAIIVLELLCRDPYDYCLSYFTTESYRASYAESINPMPNVEKPAISELDGAAVAVTPPPVKRTPGRPKAKQADTLDVFKRQLQCSKCKGLGHNKRACNRHNGITYNVTGTQSDEPEGSA